MPDEPVEREPTPPGGDEPTPPQPPVPPDPVAELRAENERLQAELRARPSPSQSPPASPPAPPTAAQIEEAYQAGRLTVEQRDQMVDELRFAERYRSHRALDDQREADRKTEERLWELRRQHPELGQAGSPLLREVEDRLRVLASRGGDPQRFATQLTAVEWVLDKRGAPMTRPRSEEIPVSTGGGTFTGGSPGSPSPRDEFSDIPQEVQAYWTRTGIAREKWAAHAAAYRARQTKKMTLLGRLAG